MFEQYGCFLPHSAKNKVHIPVNIENTKNKAKPFFNYIAEEKSEYTLKGFLCAMSNKSIEDAKVYISKNYIDAIDLTKYKDIMGNKVKSPFVIRADYDKGPKNCITDTVVMIDHELNKTSIFHIYMLQEPDRYGRWKIYGIEQE